MAYEIDEDQLETAETLRIEICPSENKRKLIDIYKDGEFFCSVGAINFKYYRELLRDEGIDVAQQKKEKILKRYKNDCTLQTLYMIRLLWCWLFSRHIV